MNAQFRKELETAIIYYPNLSIQQNGEVSYLKGILDVAGDDGIIWGSFLIEIHPTVGFPYRFPRIYETGNEIPCEDDWHKYNDNSCCLTVEQEEIIICNNGISVLRFIKDIAIPYFANQLYRKKEGRYLNEYPHGINGEILFYYELFKTYDISLWGKCIDSCFLKNHKMGRNDACYCGSGVKYKRCHMPVEEKLRILGREKAMSDLKRIINYLNICLRR